VPLIYEGMIESASQFRAMLIAYPCWRQKIEGVVIKTTEDSDQTESADG